ncbi:MAG: hypothetical protein MSS28_05065 [Tenericutes bacterium]|mgnify:CR=1 FL=1|nr:hypothetical protein [Mycoplasmatota bacterium]
MNENNVQQQVPVQPVNPPKKSHAGLLFFLIVVAGFCFYTYYEYTNHQNEIVRLKEACTPVSTTKDEKKLDLNSTIVKDLYSKVATNIKEDSAEVELNDSLKLYLASRQIPHDKIYNSNCNQFSDTSMPLYTCIDNENYTPTAFKEEDLKIEYKKLFGENAEFVNANIQLGRKCIGGYQYIESRGEYVQGYCAQVPTTSYLVEKELTKALSRESTITLYERVKYLGSEGQKLPEKLISGTYKYTFKLDTNYNYVLISKELEK